MIHLEIHSANAAELLIELTALLRGAHEARHPIHVSPAANAIDGLIKSNVQGEMVLAECRASESTPLEAAINETRGSTAEVAGQPEIEGTKSTTTAAPKGRGRPRKNTAEAPAGALSEGTPTPPSVPASQPAVENTGSDSLPPSPSVGDVAVESPVAEVKAPVTAGADAATMRKELQDLSARVNDAAGSKDGNEGLDAVAEVIEKFGFTKVSQITADKHDAIIAAARAYVKP